jgi:UDP-N-acetylmuramate dehydrogenase
MTLSYDPPKVASSGITTLNFSSFKQTSQQGADQQIRLPNMDCLIKAQVSLAAFTSFRVGGPAAWYAAPRQVEELQACYEWARSQGVPLTILGAGSNLLISDRGLPGLVIGTRHLRKSHFDPKTGLVTVGAGEPIPRLAWQAAARGWRGLEWAVGIPGTIGGAVVMNAGAHASCTADYVVNVQVLLPDGSIKLLTPQELEYRYRTSLLQGKNWTVIQATLQLQPGFDPEQVTADTQQHLNQRRASQPYHLPSCGSVFRNPKEYNAGWLIEQTGLKGHRIGGAEIAHRHANFILNCDSATATDIFQLIRHVQQTVEHHWSLWLEPEVKILGEFQTV